MPDATFACPDLTTFCRLDELGLEVTGQRLEPDRALLSCRILAEDRWCRRCGQEGSPCDTVTRRLAHEPFGWRPTTLLVTVRRYRCAGCAHVWRQDTAKVAVPRAALSRRALQWVLKAIACQHLSIARVAEGLAVSWNTANNAVLAEGQRVIDLTPVHDKTGLARLLDMVQGRSKKAFQNWLADRPKDWRDGVEVVAMDGFSGFQAATSEELPEAATAMDPFHVSRLAGNALDECRRRVQLATCGHRGRKTDPLYRARRTLHTGADLLTDRQRTRLAALFAVDAHAEVEATWTIYQRTVAAYRDPDRTKGRTMMASLIATLSTGVPKPLQELNTLGRTLKKRATDVLAYFDRPGTSNGPTEAINGRLEHLRGSALGSATSPTTSPDPYWKPADSDPNHTMDHEEPQ